MLKLKCPWTVQASTGTLHSNPNDSGAADLLHDRGGRIALLDRLADDDAAPRLDGIAPDDLVGGPVRALHEHVRLHAADDGGGRVLVEDGDRVDARE